MTAGQLICYNLAEVRLCRNFLQDLRGWWERWSGGSDRDRMIGDAVAGCSLPDGSGG